MPKIQRITYGLSRSFSKSSSQNIRNQDGLFQRYRDLGTCAPFARAPIYKFSPGDALIPKRFLIPYSSTILGSRVSVPLDLIRSKDSDL